MTSEDRNIRVVCTGEGNHGPLELAYITSWLEKDGARTLFDRLVRVPPDLPPDGTDPTIKWRQTSRKPADLLFRTTPQEPVPADSDVGWWFECRKCGGAPVVIPNPAVNAYIGNVLARNDAGVGPQEWVIDIRPQPRTRQDPSGQV